MRLIIGKKRRLEAGTEREITGETRGVAMARTNRSGGGDDTVRISFRMSGDLHRRLKLEAVRQGRTIVDMLEGFVAEHTPVG